MPDVFSHFGLPPELAQNEDGLHGEPVPPARG
jgi:hypothetical protein